MAIIVPIPEEDDRAMELSSIAAIFPEIRIDERCPFRASLDIPVTPSSPLLVQFEPGPEHFQPPMTPPTSFDTNDTGVDAENLDGNARRAARNGQDIHNLSHLPPLTLDIELPLGYPSEKPPIFNITTSPPWLPPTQILKLKRDGKRLWEECGKDMVVYTYIDHLQQMTDGAFGIADGHDEPIKLLRGLKIALLDFDIKTKRERFEQETFECGVCLEPKKGVNCHRMLLCSHVFCIPCLQGFYNSCISEGDVDNVRCMAPDCGKEPNLPIAQVQQHQDATVTSKRKKKKKQDRCIIPSELLQIPLEQEMVQRYVFLKRKKKLESDKTTVYCPRKWCQGAARSKKHPKPDDPMVDDFSESDDDDNIMNFDPMGEEAQLPPMADRLAICEDCDYAFCCVCQKGWHGELARCLPRREAELSAEEKATEEYMKMYTRQCPTCKSPCQKLMGCNHMICFHCNTHFCYLCSAWLSEDSPYLHFNTLDSSCFNRLWELEGGDGVDPDGVAELHQIPANIVDFDDASDDGGISDDPDVEDDHPAWEFAPQDNDTDSSDDDDGPARRRPPPPAPVPPRVMPVAGEAHGNQGADDHGLDAAGRAAAAERQAQALAMAQIRDRQGAREAFPRPPHRAGAGLQVRRNAGGFQPVRQEGLQRFLELVQNDQEDEWDSDELDE
ncbi:RING finger protein [Talaromyces proteolyticus]|uniref:RBR-type E3 ubiquitin transferase n=1 Tax=Talaromyces proteolyticus TaxID=1131652 RepID=A0AAD4PUI2_9EURO|nr:RING finger protein [Talaromyces proteolyticus]KAH8695126.1 RING finger protein [Talaromyces proteolyticus]